MPSQSLLRWQGQRRQALDEIEQVHASVGGTAPGRRRATQQINYAYAALLSSQFQGFCRDLHSECVDHLVAIMPPACQTFLRAEFVRNRKLDKGNPNPGNIGDDFNRFGVAFWPDVRADTALSASRHTALLDLNGWRNAIAHQDFDHVGGDPRLNLTTVRRWRSATVGLAVSFDNVMRTYLTVVLGKRPW